MSAIASFSNKSASASTKSANSKKKKTSFRSTRRKTKISRGHKISPPSKAARNAGPITRAENLAEALHNAYDEIDGPTETAVWDNPLTDGVLQNVEDVIWSDLEVFSSEPSSTIQDRIEVFFDHDNDNSRDDDQEKLANLAPILVKAAKRLLQVKEVWELSRDMPIDSPLSTDPQEIMDYVETRASAIDAVLKLETGPLSDAETRALVEGFKTDSNPDDDLDFEFETLEPPPTWYKLTRTEVEHMINATYGTSDTLQDSVEDLVRTFLKASTSDAKSLVENGEVGTREARDLLQGFIKVWDRVRATVTRGVSASRHNNSAVDTWNLLLDEAEDELGELRLLKARLPTTPPAPPPSSSRFDLSTVYMILALIASVVVSSGLLPSLSLGFGGGGNAATGAACFSAVAFPSATTLVNECSSSLLVGYGPELASAISVPPGTSSALQWHGLQYCATGAQGVTFYSQDDAVRVRCN